MIHAMLSDRTARERYLRETPWADERQDFEACEARRILAVAEARTEDADYHAAPTILWPADLPVPTAQLRKRPFHVARILANRAADRNVFVLQPEDARILVESLASFVAALDPAAYLAAQVAR